MALVIAACGGGAAGGDPETDADAQIEPMATITALANSEEGASGGEGGVVDTSPVETTTTSGSQPEQSDSGGSEENGMSAVSSSDPMVVSATTDLAARMDVPADQIVLVLREEMMWRDGSLGCPQPGFSYTQALVDGYKITLQVDGIEYAYHGQAGREPFLCQNDLAADKSGSSVTLEPKEDDGADDLNDDGSIDE